jgi:glycerophosphoryl diester phosphodiesterase
VLRRSFLTALVLLVLAPATAVAAVPQIHAHRGGPQQLGQPAFAEETMPAFRDAWEQRGAVLELDVKLSADGVPAAIHDDTLDRTTVCTGPVSDRTWADLRANCPSDVIGIDPHPTAAPRRPVPMASLAAVLAYAKRSGAPLNIEIKNIPGDNDFDPSPAYAQAVVDVIRASGVPLSQVIVQSFWPPNLDVVAAELPGAQTSLLTFSPVSTAGPEFAAARGYDWWSPEWPVTAADVARAHAAGVKVAPWTVDTPDGIRAVATAGADAVITNDPVMARRALGLPDAIRRR